MIIRLATAQDIPALMTLEARYYVGNLEVAERAGGYISVLHPQEWWTWAVAATGVHVAVNSEDRLVGFIAVTLPPLRADPVASPIVGAVMKLTTTVEFKGRPIAQQRWAFRGPVLIDQEARGQGLYSLFNDVTRQAYRARYDLGVLFVAADNQRSLHTTTGKLGATSVALFDVAGKEYHLLVVDYRCAAPR